MNGGIAVFWAPPVEPYHKCKTCADLRWVFLWFLRKSWSELPVTTRKASAWLDGDEMNHAGWHIIEKTKQYACPQCGDKPSFTPRPTVPRASKPKIQVAEQLREIGEQLAIESREEEDWTEMWWVT